MSYKKYNWEVIAEDYNSMFLRNYIWVNCFFRYKELFNAPRPLLGIIYNKGNIKYITDLKTWGKTHEHFKKKVLKYPKFIERIIDITDANGKKMSDWTEKSIFKTNLKKLSGTQLAELLRRFAELQEKQSAHGVVLPILDFQGFSFIEQSLKDFLKKHVSKGDYQEYYTVFTSPTKNSFAQDQDLDLLRLMAKYFDNHALMSDLKTKEFSYLEKSYPNFCADLKKHTKKYCWVYFVYDGPEYMEDDFIVFIRDYLEKGIMPSVEIEKHKIERKDLIVKQRKYVDLLKPNKFDLEILKLAGKIIWGKPRRKDYESKSYFHAKKLMKEIGRRLYLSLDQAKSTPFNMIDDGLIHNKKIDTELINSIKSFNVCVPNDNGSVSVLIGKEAKQFSESIVQKTKKNKMQLHPKVIKGDCACAGNSVGTVKVINRSEDMKKMNYGDILVSSATSPSIIPAMKKASAIITDEGGLTCHASIVSREMNIPCVIGTKIVTKVLKDGDRVEVNATNGIVRKLIE